MAATEVTDLISGLFEGLNNREYFRDFRFNEALGVAEPSDEMLLGKMPKDPLSSVDPENYVPYPPEFDDLVRLHWLITTRRVVTVLEIGSGYSTAVFNHAMEVNASRYPKFDGALHRKSNVFEVHSLDTSQGWINTTRQLGDLTRVHFHHSEVEMTLFCDRICTMFLAFPNVAPDLIYLDGPDQHNLTGDVRGVTTAHLDRFPMSADLLAIEHFLAPGTLIVVDGRTANARFLASNFQREWAFERSEEFDQTFFELRETPLGRFSKKLMDFQLSGRTA
jgi:hypothetical protein